MSRLNEVKDIYDNIMNTVTSSKQEWKNFLNFASRVYKYKYKFDNRILIYAQKPDATAVADMKLWNRRIGRYINKGTRSIAVFDKTKTPLVLEHLFDVSDTNGSPWTLPKLWKLNEKIMPKLVDGLSDKWSIKKMSLENLVDKQVEKMISNNSETYLKGGLKELENQSNYDMKDQYIKTVEDSANYMIYCRCGLDLSKYESLPTFENISDFNTEIITRELGYAISNISEEILRETEKEVYNIIKKIRSEENEKRTISRTRVRGRGRRDVLSQDTNIQQRGIRQETFREIRKDVSQLPKGQSREKIQLAIDGRRFDENLSSSGRRSVGQIRDVGRTDVEERSNTQSRKYVRDIQTQRYDKERSRGNSVEGDSVRREVKNETFQEKNKEQISMFESQNSGSFSISDTPLKIDSIIEIKNRTYKIEKLDIEKNQIEMLDLTTSIPITRVDRYSNILKELEQQKTDVIDEKADEILEESNEHQELINYKYNPADEIGVGGLKTKYKNNVEAIKTLKIIEEENRLSTLEEQKILAKYVGWGGMPQVFDKNSNSWSKEYTELKALLTPEEYSSARASTPNAHYTSPIVVSEIYKALDKFNFKTGNILEPAMGVGNFFFCTA